MIKLNVAPALIALSLAGLVAGCASQSTSEPANESANNAATGQSDVVSQTNPLDAAPTPAPVDTMPAAPAGQYAEAQPAPMASTQPAPATTEAWTSTTTAGTDMSGSTAAPMDTAEEPLPPRADRN